MVLEFWTHFSSSDQLVWWFSSGSGFGQTSQFGGFRVLDTFLEDILVSLMVFRVVWSVFQMPGLVCLVVLEQF